jgi:hypothetical protein
MWLSSGLIVASGIAFVRLPAARCPEVAVGHNNDEATPRQPPRDCRTDAVLLAATCNERHALAGFGHGSHPLDVQLGL